MSDQFRKAECEGKKGWPTPQSVYKAFRHRKHKMNGANVFHCSWCGKYHVGHMKVIPRGR